MVMSDTTHYYLGAQVPPMTVKLYRDSQFGTSITGLTDWVIAPRLVFNDDDEDVWQSTIDPSNSMRAIFIEEADQVNMRFSGEKVEMWVDDIVIMSGLVEMQGD